MWWVKLERKISCGTGGKGKFRGVWEVGKDNFSLVGETKKNVHKRGGKMNNVVPLGCVTQEKAGARSRGRRTKSKEKAKDPSNQ